MLTIEIKNQEVFAYHGVYADEKRDGQRFIISTKALMDYRACDLDDDIANTLSYALLAEKIEEISTEKSYDLIESLCENIINRLFTEFAGISELEVEVKKPDAPMPIKVEYPAVKIRKKWHEVYIGVGTNLGDREKNIDDAILALADFAQVESIAEVISTKPWGVLDQPDFLNTVLKARTLLEPHELLKSLKNIESSLGRVKTRRWGERLIDLDILLYDELILDSGDLIIPHPYLEERDFVLKPLCEIAPYKVHPVLSRRIFRLLEDLENKNE